MDRLEHRRAAAGRVDVGRGGKAQPALDRRAQVGQDVAEQVRRHHHVQRLGCQHHPGGQRVDVIGGDLDLGIFGGDLAGDLVPEHHGMALRVRLGDRSQSSRPPLRLFEAKAQDAFDPGAGEDRGLDRDLVRGALMQPAAGASVFAFGVLADAQDVEAALSQRPLDPAQQPVRPDIGVLHEGLADRQQQTVKRDRVRHPRRPADRAQEDRIETAQGLDAVLGHHPPGRQIGVAGPVETGRLEQPRGDGFGHLQRGLHNRNTDAVTGDEGDLVSHGGPRLSGQTAIRTDLLRRLAW